VLGETPGRHPRPSALALRRTPGARQIGVLAILTCALLVPTNARAAILGLGPGTYDVALTCTFINCGGPFTGTLSTDGSDITSWLFDTNFDGLPLSFNGDPTEFDSGPPADVQMVSGPNTIGGYTLNLFGGVFAGDWFIDSGGVSIWNGSWEAKPHQDAVPEPATLTLFGTSIVSLIARARRQRRKQSASRT